MNTNIPLHEHLYRELGHDAHVLELGSGKGTENLVSLFRDVTTIEHDPRYLGEVLGAHFIHAPLSPYQNEYFREATLWYDPERLLLQLPDDYDAIIVDGPKGSQGRGGFYTNLDLFNTDTLIYFDDIHRMWEFRLMGRVAQRLGVTATVHPGTDGRRWFGVVDGRPS